MATKSTTLVVTGLVKQFVNKQPAQFGQPLQVEQAGNSQVCKFTVEWKIPESAIKDKNGNYFDGEVAAGVNPEHKVYQAVRVTAWGYEAENLKRYCVGDRVTVTLRGELFSTLRHDKATNQVRSMIGGDWDLQSIVPSFSDHPEALQTLRQATQQVHSKMQANGYGKPAATGNPFNQQQQHAGGFQQPQGNGFNQPTAPMPPVPPQGGFNFQNQQQPAMNGAWGNHGAPQAPTFPNQGQAPQGNGFGQPNPNQIPQPPMNPNGFPPNNQVAQADLTNGFQNAQAQAQQAIDQQNQALAQANAFGSGFQQ